MFVRIFGLSPWKESMNLSGLPFVPPDAGSLYASVPMHKMSFRYELTVNKCMKEIKNGIVIPTTMLVLHSLLVLRAARR